MTRAACMTEARSRFGSQSASELGALVACSIPEQLPGTSPHQLRKDEDGNALARSPRPRAAEATEARRGRAPCGLEVDHHFELDGGLDGRSLGFGPLRIRSA
jgi:hypothetical protein